MEAGKTTTNSRSRAALLRKDKRPLLSSSGDAPGGRARQEEAPGIAELPDTDGHFQVTRSRLGPVCAEQAIPPGEVESEVAVGLYRDDRVMDPVHVGGDHEEPQGAVEPAREADGA